MTLSHKNRKRLADVKKHEALCARHNAWWHSATMRFPGPCGSPRCPYERRNVKITSHVLYGCSCFSHERTHPNSSHYQQNVTLPQGTILPSGDVLAMPIMATITRCHDCEREFPQAFDDVSIG